MAKFAVTITYGPDTDKRLATRPTHREYLKELGAKGKLLHAGPFADDLGGLLIYEADSENEVRSILEEDPYTKEGVLSAVEIREWNRVLP